MKCRICGSEASDVGTGLFGAPVCVYPVACEQRVQHARLVRFLTAQAWAYMIAAADAQVLFEDGERVVYLRPRLDRNTALVAALPGPFFLAAELLR